MNDHPPMDSLPLDKIPFCYNSKSELYRQKILCRNDSLSYLMIGVNADTIDRYKLECEFNYKVYASYLYSNQHQSIFVYSLLV